ncbi:MAG: hypothetical protein IKS93_02000 [Methanobrevibacter sp.]|nr:hypothetical protein [Methanobrevibacter sp.]
MLPQTLPLISDFKKDYKFLWYIDGREVDENQQKYFSQRNRLIYTTLQDPVYRLYVSQLAETISIPEDEFETDSIQTGPVSYEIPKKVKMNHITVTYLEDSLNSVYNYHRTWFNAIRDGQGTTFNTPASICSSARYIEFENTMTAMEYVTLHNAGFGSIDDEGNRVMTNIRQLVAGLKDTLKPELQYGSHVTSETTYPRIYPIRIQRTQANKGGSGLHKVTVTYARIPKIYKSKTNLQVLDGQNQWANLTELTAIHLW